MHYKGYSVTVTVDGIGTARTRVPKFIVRSEGTLVHEGAVHGEFPDQASAEDAAYSAAREWIEAKCRVN
jgi:hypothetical protein